jgi:hypothetical protein
MSPTRSLIVVSMVIFAFSCKRAVEEPAAAPAQSAPAPATAAPAPVTQTAAPAAAQPSVAVPAPAVSLSSQETNWKGVTATVTEFRRKGNTLTARVRLANTGTDEVQPDILYNEIYLLDTNNGKKYQVLKDEKDTYIAGNRAGWNYRWYGSMKPGDTHTVWMKFPAPPADVKTITLQVTGMPPFEDVAIQD